MKAVPIILFLSCFVIYLSSCTSDQAEHISCPPDIACTNFGQDSMTFNQDIVSILTTYCTAPGGDMSADCHGAASYLGYDFTTYGGVIADTALFNYYVFDPATSTMPKSTSPGPTTLACCDKEKLELWIAQGAPE